MKQVSLRSVFQDGGWGVFDDTRLCPARDTKEESFLAGVIELLCGEFGYTSKEIPEREILKALVAGEKTLFDSKTVVVETFGHNRLSCKSVGMSFDISMLDE